MAARTAGARIDVAITGGRTRSRSRRGFQELLLKDRERFLHPHADRLKIVMVDVGRPKPIQIVCGGVNMTTESIGWNIVVALEGAMLNGLEIKQPSAAWNRRG